MSFHLSRKWKLNETGLSEAIPTDETAAVVGAIAMAAGTVVAVVREVDTVEVGAEATTFEKIRMVVTTLTRGAPTVAAVATTREMEVEDLAGVNIKVEGASVGTEMMVVEAETRALVAVAMRTAASIVRLDQEAEKVGGNSIQRLLLPRTISRTVTNYTAPQRTKVAALHHT